MRVSLHGEGEPIPIQALPDELPVSDQPPLMFVLDGTEPFPAGDYVSLGYTNFEAICIGAAGGRGGDGFLTAQFEYEWVSNVVLPLSLRAEYRNYVRRIYEDALDEANDRIRVASYDRRVPAYGYGRDPFWTDVNSEWMNFVTWFETIDNQDGMGGSSDPYAVNVTKSFNPILISARAWGGAGGGGGLHIAGGLLADLPASVPVVVGRVGADGVGGLMRSPDPVVPLPYDLEYVWPPTGTFPNVNQFIQRYDEPRTAFGAPQLGADGGYSAFGDVCRASGGKGGGPGIIWPGGVRTLAAYGGDGGVGDSLVAGGGAAGATTGADGAEGTWVGNVGKGGGGGRGGSRAAGTTESSMHMAGMAALPDRTAGQGGRGSYSFADPAVYGDRQPKSRYQTPNYVYAQTQPDPNTIRNALGGITYTDSGWVVIPGGGGGAKVKPPLTGRFGSKTISYSPDGAVLLRISKVD